MVERNENQQAKIEFRHVPIESIRLGRITARNRLDDKSLAELSLSIENLGLIEPVILRPRNRGYEVVAGMRRVLAAQQIGLKTIPALVQNLTDFEAFEFLMAENLQREDFNPMEIASLLTPGVEKLGYSQ